MLGGHHHVAHAGSARDLGPIAGGKGLGFELLCERSVFGNRYAFILHDPLMTAKHTVKPPVNEHAKAGFVPPLHAARTIGVGGGRRRLGLGRRLTEEALIDWGEARNTKRQCCRRHGRT